MEKEKEPKFELLLSRFRLVGEGIVPEDEFPDLPGQGSLWIFLEEPDPDKWPEEMSHLKKYLDYE